VFDVLASIGWGGSEARKAAAGERQGKQWPHHGREGSWRRWLAEETLKEGQAAAVVLPIVHGFDPQQLEVIGDLAVADINF
jgi:hypothetical protein